MAIKELVRMGNPILRLTSTPVAIEDIQTQEMKSLLTDMYDTMKENGGIGIAAPQIGVSSQVSLIEIPENSTRYEGTSATQLFTIINPKIEITNNEPQGFWEGCLSVPGLKGYVERPQGVKVNYLDENAQEKSIEFTGFLATVFQHEIDHLNGILFTDHLDIEIEEAEERMRKENQK